MRDIYDDHTGLQDRFRGCGRVSPELATKLGLLGLAGAQSGIARDVRCDLPCAPYDALDVARSPSTTAATLRRALPYASIEALESTRLIIAITAALLDPAGVGRS